MKEPLIFKHYEGLRNKISYLSLGNFPTPIIHFKKLGRIIGCNNLYTKQDNINSNYYGGNKVRKLEFILADAIKKKKKSLITIGAAGSNHALATTIYGKNLEMKTTLLLFPQIPASYLRKNLLLDFYFGAEIKYLPSVYLIPFYAIFQMIKKFFVFGQFPYYVPPGGSSVFGILGFLNAVFELKEQIEKKEIPAPDLIFVPAGTCGTAAGLELGIRAAQINTKIISVKVVDKFICNPKKISNLVNKTAKFLHKIDKKFPEIKIVQDEIYFLEDYFGGEYARITDKSKISVELMNKLENINIEGTYTGKTIAALIDYCYKFDVKDKNILFWNTFNSIDLSEYIKNLDYNVLPKPLHKYFECSLQENETKTIEDFIGKVDYNDIEDLSKKIKEFFC